MSVVTILPDCKHGIKTNSSDTPTNSIKSMESLYTNSSSKFSALNRRKVSQRNRDRNPSLVPAVSEIKQRVISARLLRMKQLQNQIGEAQHRIAELTSENRLLKSLHKRQDSALSKYESSSAELPKLLSSHAEEVRVWQTRCRALQRQNKELQTKIKQKDTIILTITDQNKHLLQLNKDKNLEEREKLSERVKDLEHRLMDKDNDMKLLARRLQLETKAYKTNLGMEQQKYRDLLSKIELSDYLTQRDVGDKKSPKLPRQPNQRVKSPSRSLTSKSATNLANGNGTEKDHMTLILPPCEGLETKKPEESIRTNSPRVIVNSNVKPLPSTTNGDVEVNLSKNRVDRSESFKNGHSGDSDDITILVRNGANRARAQLKSTKNPAKLTPLAPKQEPKKSSDDSELSDDDFQLYSEHNGTKTAHNARDLLEHKMHLSELESKMKQNSLDVKKHDASSSSSSQSDHQHPISSFGNMPALSFADRGDTEFASFHREMRNSMMQRESFLDDYCDTIVDEKSDFSGAKTATSYTKIKKLELASPPPVAPDNLQTPATHHPHYHNKSNGSVRSGKPIAIDARKKSALLASLKNIDNESYEA